LAKKRNPRKDEVDEGIQERMLERKWTVDSTFEFEARNRAGSV
jgi:hypothetical protein